MTFLTCCAIASFSAIEASTEWVREVGEVLEVLLTDGGLDASKL